MGQALNNKFLKVSIVVALIALWVALPLLTSLATPALPMLFGTEGSKGEVVDGWAVFVSARTDNVYLINSGNDMVVNNAASPYEYSFIGDDGVEHRGVIFVYIENESARILDLPNMQAWQVFACSLVAWGATLMILTYAIMKLVRSYPRKMRWYITG